MPALSFALAWNAYWLDQWRKTWDRELKKWVP